MCKLKIFQQSMGIIGIFLVVFTFVVFSIQGVSSASPNDACFNGGCHVSPNPRPINQSLYNSNAHSIIKCIDCHVNSTDPVNDSNHGIFIRQLNGSNITGPLTSSYYSQNFSLCYYCHAEKNVVGVLPGYVMDIDHRNPPVNVSNIGTNFINNLSAGYSFGGNYPTNIHWDHLDDFGSLRWGVGALFDLDPGANLTNNRSSRESCPACHNVHGTNFPRMTREDLAITYGSDAIGNFGYINSYEYKLPGGDVFCNGCHSYGMFYKYYRNETNVFEDCVSCHVDGISGGLQGNVNRTAFSQGMHVDINTTDGIGLVNNSDCWACHFNRDMNRSNIWQCADCHTRNGTYEAPQAPRIHSHLPAVTNYSCMDCHSKTIINPGAGIPNITSHYALRPIVPTSNYCDYCHGPNASSPFPAVNKTIPEFSHNDPDWNADATCRTCHTNSSVSADPLANDISSFHDMTTELGDTFNGTVKADCVLCHIQKAPQFVSAPDPSHDTTGMAAADCYECHGLGLNGTQPQKLHSVTEITTTRCIACHSNSSRTYYVNMSLFGKHANVNNTDGLNNLTDDDCRTCHFGSANGTMRMVLGAANQNNTYFCDDCHTAAGTGPIKPTDPGLMKNNLRHGSADCKWCHIAGDPLPRPLNGTLKYHPNGPKGTASGINCLTCHQNANLPDLPFHAPGIKIDTLPKHSVFGILGCKGCHSTNLSFPVNDNHSVLYKDSNTPPTISGLSITTPVVSGVPAGVQATVTDDMLQIAAAQYQVANASGVIIDWTNMTPVGGRFSLSIQPVNASIDTSKLKGNYTVNVKGMASAPKTDTSKPYYPLNGDWSGVVSANFTVT
ncbi:MAG: hypothetical protein O8C66_13800 [Candidatus Methanoperedens sp.]|nr:hypothetical protein [Candidatus Methanoperedens sp.]MCZ7371573.1 hypothetical protein [Candidatus Methanoperedens sp.]